MPKPLRVLVIGPKYAAADSRGGMAELIGLMRDCPDDRVRVRTIATFVDDRAARRLRVGVLGVLHSVARVLLGQVDVVHVHLAHRGSVVRKSFPLLAARLTGTPAIVHAHSYDFAGWFDALNPLAQRVVRLMLPADHWYVLGDALAEQYRTRLRLRCDEVRVLPNPVRLPDREAPAGGASDAQDAGDGTHAVGPADALAVSFGRLGGRKGSYDLIAALEQLDPDARGRLRVIIAGDGEVDGVRAAAQRAGVGDVLSVRSWVDAAERDELLARADIFVLPSYDEGLPLALLEAMAFGLAPITTPVGAIPEVVRDGVSALLVPPGDPAALARALERLTLEAPLRAAVGTAARERAANYDSTAWFARVVTGWIALAAARH